MLISSWPDGSVDKILDCRIKVRGSRPELTVLFYKDRTGKMISCLQRCETCTGEG